jgi:hypothetical protein
LWTLSIVDSVFFAHAVGFCLKHFHQLAVLLGPTAIEPSGEDGDYFEKILGKCLLII